MRACPDGSNDSVAKDGTFDVLSSMPESGIERAAAVRALIGTISQSIVPHGRIDWHDGTTLMKQILSVGQCGFDHNSIDRFFKGHFAVNVFPAATAKDAISQLRQRSFDLVLVNRQFDADGDEGLDFIECLKADRDLSAIPVMLITNFREYAQQAISYGALSGFGKSELGSPELVKRLESHFESSESADR